MKKVVHKSKTITLQDSEFLASGGQADIYLHKGTIFKVFHSAMDPDLLSKIQELMVLDRPNIIRPLDAVFSDITSLPIGYTMDYADNCVGLPLLFTSSYLTRNNVTLQSTQELVQNMAETIEFIHQKQILLVDGNELNYLVNKKGYNIPYFIDVDSYETPKHKALVIMPSVRDYQSRIFSRATDYYSFGVVSFQLFTGIHPYKGKHDIFKTVEERCKANMSVLNKEVRCPASIRDFQNIPKSYLDWYTNMFEKGERAPPPSISSAPQVRIYRKIISANFAIEKLFSAAEDIQSVEWIFGNMVVITSSEIYINLKPYKRVHPQSVVVNSLEGVLYEAYFTDKEGLHLRNIFKNIDTLDRTKAANEWFSVQGRLYSVFEKMLMELVIRQMGENITTVIKTANTIAGNTQIFKGVLSADILGATYVYIPKASGICDIRALSSLNKHKILDANYNKNALTISSAFQGEYYITNMLFDSTINPPLEVIEKSSDIPEINIIRLSTGVSLELIGDQLSAFLTEKPSGSRKVIQPANLPNDTVLYENGSIACYTSGKDLFKFSLK